MKTLATSWPHPALRLGPLWLACVSFAKLFPCRVTLVQKGSHVHDSKWPAGAYLAKLSDSGGRSEHKPTGENNPCWKQLIHVLLDAIPFVEGVHMNGGKAVFDTMKPVEGLIAFMLPVTSPGR